MACRRKPSKWVLTQSLKINNTTTTISLNAPSYNIDDSLYQRRWNSWGPTWIESCRGADSSQLRAVGLFDIRGLTFPGFRLKWSTFWVEQEKRGTRYLRFRCRQNILNFVETTKSSSQAKKVNEANDEIRAENNMPFLFTQGPSIVSIVVVVT